MRLLALSWCLWWLAPVISPAASPPPSYPIGIYAVNSTNDFSMVKDAGFNLVSGSAAKSYLDAAQAAGLRVLAVPGTQAGSTFDPAAARRTVRALDKHPALWAWYVVDEPDLNGIPPEAVSRANRILKAAGARKPTALVLYRGYETLNYGNITDIMLIDRYPIPWLPLANFGQHVGLARLGVGKDKPLVAIIQAFDWSIDARELPGQKNLRPPAYEEMRCMTYEALARGANGLFYYAFDAGWKMREHPDTWSALSRIIHEVNQRLPLFMANHQWWAKKHAFGDPAKQYNAALESSVTSCLLQVQKGNAQVPAGDYILAVNNTDQAQDYSVALPAHQPSTLNPQPINVLDERRVIQPEASRLRDLFAPYDVHIYGPLSKMKSRN